jgi:hypothetical protein
MPITKFTYRGIKYQSRPILQLEPSEQLFKQQRLNFFIWRGISYSKNLHRQLGLNRDDEK